MHHSTLHRAIVRLQRCLSVAALALTLATVVSPPSSSEPEPPKQSQGQRAPRVNWNS
jgi:hypothetical protein